MRNQRPSGLLCGCGATRILCECIRDQDQRPCCWACEHHDLPADIRQPACVEVKAKTFNSKTLDRHG